MKRIILSLLLLIFHTQASAHPVIYEGGWVISSSNMQEYSNNFIGHSLTSNFALGLNHWRFGMGDNKKEGEMVKLNHLLWRKNGLDSQANVYLHGGLGALKDSSGQGADWDSWGLLGVEADWETRVLYTSIKHFQFHTPHGIDIPMTQGRVGFSPKLAGFNELQTWFMVQGMVIGGVQDELMITPMMRFFYHNILWEIGASTQGEWMLNLMVHY